MDMTARLDAIAKLPKDWRMIAVYSDGKVRTLDQPFKGSTEAAAKAERRYLNKIVHTHADGSTVTLDIVEVQYIGNDWEIAAAHIGCTVAELKGI